MSDSKVEAPQRQGRGPSPLSVPAFRLLWLNQITFFFAANALRFVYGWVALDGLNADESIQGLLVFALGIPNIFIVLPAGVWADRLNRQRMLIFTQVALAIVMCGTAILLGAGAGSIPILITSAVLAGIATAIGSPVRQSLVPELLPKDLLLGGIALGALAMTASLIGGAVTAQFVGERFGFNGAFWYLMVLVLVGAMIAVPMRVPAAQRVDASKPTMREAVGDGVQFVWQNRALRSLFALLAMSGFIMTPLMFVTVQAFVKEELGRDAGDAAPLMALMGVGLAVTSLYVMKRGDMPDKGVKFMRAMLGGTSVLFLMGRATAYWQLMVLSLIMGMCGGIFINMNQGLIQANTPKDMMGRTMGLFTLVNAGFMPIGALILGIIASQIGVAITLSGAAALGFAIVAFTYTRATELRALK